MYVPYARGHKLHIDMYICICACIHPPMYTKIYVCKYYLGTICYGSQTLAAASGWLKVTKAKPLLLLASGNSSVSFNSSLVGYLMLTG